MGVAYKKETFAARLTRLYDAEPDASLDRLGQIAAGHGRKPISPQAAHKWLKGKAIPTADKLRNIADHFKVTREWLLFGDSPRHPLSMDIAHAADMLSDDDMRELARYAARLLDSCKDIPGGTNHDQFIAKLRRLSDALRKPH